MKERPSHKRLQERGQGNGCYSPARHIHCWWPLHRLWSGPHRGQSAGPVADRMPRATLQAQHHGCPTVWCLTPGAEWGLSDWHAPFPLHSPLQRLGAHGQHSCWWRCSDTPHNLEVRTGMRGGIVMVLTKRTGALMVLGEAQWLKPPTVARHHSNHLHELFYDRRSW